MGKQKVEQVGFAQSLAAVIGQSRGVDSESVMRALTEGVAQVLGGPKGIRVEMEMDTEHDIVRFWEVRRIVEDDDESLTWDSKSPEAEAMTERVISISEARAQDPAAEVDDFFRVPVPISEFSRVEIGKITQKLKETIRHGYKKSVAEESDIKREVLKNARFIGSEADGTAVFAIVPDGIQAILKPSEQIPYIPEKKSKTPGKSTPQLPKEVFVVNEIYPVVVIGAESESGKPTGRMIVSRRRDSLLRQVIKREVPEVQEGDVLIKRIAQFPGVKAKIAVAPDPKKNSQFNAKGMLIGMQQESRKRAISRQLNNMELEFVDWSEDLELFVRYALENTSRGMSARNMITKVEIEERDNPEKKRDKDGRERQDKIKIATVYVMGEDSKKRIIGADSENVRLAVKLTGCSRIDVRILPIDAEPDKDGTEEDK